MYIGEQLAKNWKGWEKHGAEKLWIEPKHDGYRCTIYVDRIGAIFVHCRKSKAPSWLENIAHIVQAVQALDLRSCIIDGEVMSSSWNELSKLLRRKRANMSDELKARIIAEVKLQVFDYIDRHAVEQRVINRRTRSVDPTPAHARRALVAHVVAQDDTGILQHTAPDEVVDEDELADMYAYHLECGHEGSMVKDPAAPYVFARSEGWLKMKPTKTFEVTVEGGVEGLGKHAGRLGTLLCRNAAGEPVRVGGGFSDALREALWADDGLTAGTVGRRLEVRAQDDAVAVARHPQFVRFRTEQE